MKLFTSLMLASMFLINTSQGGGVTVGNGQGSIIVGFNLQNHYLFEKELMSSVEELIQQIKNGEFERINEIIAKGNCDPSHIKVEKFRSKKFYIIDQGVFKKEKEFVGYLQIELKECQNTDAIMADDPYGGFEFWEN